jgi:acyl-CoA synthetase (AMP-forming)/AMP-acid ligase II
MPFPDYLPTTATFIRELAKRFADQTLIVLDDRRLGFAEAEAQSARLARALLSRGLGKGSHVGLLMPNGPDWLVAWLAVTRIGGLLVPLNTFFKTRELGWILRHADVQTLLTVSGYLGHDYLERLEAAAPGLSEAGGGPLRIHALPYLREICVWGACDRAWAVDGEALVRGDGIDPQIDDDFLRSVEECVTPADPMVIMYSSGSTADPKGAVHSHGTVIRHSYNLGTSRDLCPEDRVWSPMPFFWVGGFVFSLVGNMHAGATTLCEEVFDPATTLAFLERERVSVALGWPHFGKALAEHPSHSERDLSSLRAGNVPDLLPPEIVHPDPERRQNALGMTETCGPHTWSTGAGPLPENLRSSFGVAVEGVEHRVIDPETGEVLPPGELGEICVRGYSLMQGLYKLERDDVFEADGFYRTGDGGYFDADGVLYFKGRLGDMIKSGGANVTPSEVEQVLVSFPEIKEAYVVGVDDPDRGQAVEAAIVLEHGQTVEADEIRGRVKQELSAYKVPRHVFVYPDGALPFTDTGKIDKRKLAVVLQERLASGGA